MLFNLSSYTVSELINLREVDKASNEAAKRELTKRYKAVYGNVVPIQTVIAELWKDEIHAKLAVSNVYKFVFSTFQSYGVNNLFGFKGLDTTVPRLYFDDDNPRMSILLYPQFGDCYAEGYIAPEYLDIYANTMTRAINSGVFNSSAVSDLHKLLAAQVHVLRNGLVIDESICPVANSRANNLRNNVLDVLVDDCVNKRHINNAVIKAIQTLAANYDRYYNSADSTPNDDAIHRSLFNFMYYWHDNLADSRLTETERKFIVAFANKEIYKVLNRLDVIWHWD